MNSIEDVSAMPHRIDELCNFLVVVGGNIGNMRAGGKNSGFQIDSLPL